LDWNTFFALRKTRRRYQQACSIVTMMIGGSLAGLVLINIDVDFLGKLPLDPFITLGLITMSSAALGWLAGPSLGSTIFYIAKRGVKTPMANKEVEFFGRIKKNRVDPSVSSVGNPVPDYYGEKISSVAGYRQWLKDQRAFNKKRTSFL
ncbi:mitochondrial import protein Pam17, partial [Truncatella angustata]